MRKLIGLENLPQDTEYVLGSGEVIQLHELLSDADIRVTSKDESMLTLSGYTPLDDDGVFYKSAATFVAGPEVYTEVQVPTSDIDTIQKITTGFLTVGDRLSGRVSSAGNELGELVLSSDQIAITRH